jgi:hypothetical protein
VRERLRTPRVRDEIEHFHLVIIDPPLDPPPLASSIPQWSTPPTAERKKCIKTTHTPFSLFSLPTTTMDKPTSIIAALNAGKLPTTQQFNEFIDYLTHVGIVKLESESGGELSAQGKVLADDLRDVLSADRKLLNDKNGKCFR